MSTRVGIGFDVHAFSRDQNRLLVLGGVNVPGHAGLDGHSDADVIAHAVADALLGAAGLGDIGEHFPETDDHWSGANSIELLCMVTERVVSAGWRVENLDCTVVIEAPKIAPYRAEMQRRLTDATGAPVNVKATRAEGLGSIGRVEGAACWAVATIVELP